jgi:FkbM family methyltransferase
MARLKENIKKFILLTLPKSIKRLIENELRSQDYYKFLNSSFSQEGEDLILSRFFELKSNGFYVDVGAYHPIRFSNTYKFYLMGWRGINIDAMPGSMRIFDEIRPDDINLEIPISDNTETLTYYIFNEPALNTFSPSEASKKDDLGNFKIVRKEQLSTQRLDTILDEHLPKDRHIDFLTIDVEGLDFKVLKSNNWDKYKPDIVLLEDLQSDIERAINSEIYNFMKLKGYKLLGRTFNTLVFKLA